ncbi:MAG: hypothetical protein ACWIPI_05590 [Polaribacter sp.]
MERKTILRNIILLTIIGLIIGLIKVEFFLINVPNKYIKLARITSYISLGIGSIFFYFIVILSILMAYFTVDMMKIGTHFNIGNFYKSVNYFIYALILNEILKLIITILFYENTIMITSEETMLENLELNSLWLNLTNISDYFFFISGAIISGIYLNKVEKNINIIESIVTMLPLIIAFFIFRYIYV